MDIQNKLSGYVNQGIDRNTDAPQPTPNYSAFLNLFGINLVHRFPDVTNLDTIDANVVESIARFSAICSTIALDTWQDVLGSMEQQRRQRRPTTSRAA